MNEIKSTVEVTQVIDSYVKADVVKMKELTDDMLSALSDQFDNYMAEYESTINSIKSNYISDTSEVIQTKFIKMKENNAPAFRKAIMDCAKYVNEEVAKFYEDTENTGAENVGGAR